MKYYFPEVVNLVKEFMECYLWDVKSSGEICGMSCGRSKSRKGKCIVSEP